MAHKNIKMNDQIFMFSSKHDQSSLKMNMRRKRIVAMIGMIKKKKKKIGSLNSINMLYYILLMVIDLH